MATGAMRVVSVCLLIGMVTMTYHIDDCVVLLCHARSQWLTVCWTAARVDRGVSTQKSPQANSRQMQQPMTALPSLSLRYEPVICGHL